MYVCEYFTLGLNRINSQENEGRGRNKTKNKET